MPQLSISKVAVGCTSLDALKARQAARAAGGEVPLVTRFMPKRAEELVGGSVYWIVKHRIQARQTILGFTAREEDRKTLIRLSPELVPVTPVPAAPIRAGAISARTIAPQISAATNAVARFQMRSSRSFPRCS
jgi:hypothetical protein